MGDVEFLPHTGDIGFRVRADSAEDLFATAARGMFDVLVEGDGGEAVEDAIEVEEEGRDLLLRAWLDELLFRFLVDGKIYDAFEFEALDERRAAARLRGRRFDPARHELRTELKAVTYHGLEVKNERDAWLATVIFDV